VRNPRLHDLYIVGLAVVAVVEAHKDVVGRKWNFTDSTHLAKAALAVSLINLQSVLFIVYLADPAGVI